MSAQRPTPALVHVPHPELSLWQSAVHEVLADRYAAGNVSAPSILTHERAREADAHAYEMLDPARHPRLRTIVDLARRVHLGGIAVEAETILAATGSYSNDDPKFVAQCISRFVEWYGLGRRPVYRDWTKEGGGDIDFGRVDWRLPAGARIAVIGDWGTGLDDARALLRQLVATCRPSALLHLGDIYYSGTPREAACNFAHVLTETFAEHPPRIPVFNLPGNHDYYSGGGGFHGLLDTTNEGAARQAASYFCLRSEDDRWQLVGIDTAFNDRTPGMPFDPHYTAPALHEHEAEWLAHKLGGFQGPTLLFSHHQLFSAHCALNGPKSGRPRRNVNDDLLGAVAGHLDRIALWMWGHEHSLAVYEDGLEGLPRCRLVGCSAFETETDDDPYEVVYPDTPYRREQDVRLSLVDGLYSHGAAVIDLGQQAIEYYQMQSWSGAAPVPLPPLTLMYREELRPAH
jgi:hypothetical protein